MKQLCLVISILVLMGTPRLASAQRGLGLGVILGEPTGVSVKTWLTPETAFAMAAAWSFVDEDAVHLHGDYLIHNFNTFPVQNATLPFYYGVGARLKIHEDDSRVGIRVPFGISYLFERSPVDVFLELVPLLDVAPSTELTMNASLGARYYFH